MAGSVSNLIVDTSGLSTLSSYLEKAQAKIVELLGALNTEAGGLSTCWKDSAGTEYVTQFGEFIKRSNAISNQIGQLKKFVDESSSQYSEIVNKYAGML